MGAKSIAVLAICLVALANGHSWLDCSNWKLNDPTGYTTHSAARFSDADGTCAGWARRFEKAPFRIFGKMDECQFFRHYIQGNAAIGCRRNAGGYSGEGSNEGRSNPVSLAYGPNKNVYGDTYGTMAEVYAGDPICWRWPAKNHMAHVDAATNMVKVLWDTQTDRTGDITQAEFLNMELAQLPFANCPVPGPVSSGDSSGVGSELRPCGGCFTVPNYAPGVYQVQWYWPFKANNAETYTSCADIRILGSTSTTPVNCVVGAWGSWSQCSADCGGATQKRTRSVTTPASGGGTACSALTETRACNTGACNNFLSEHVVFDDEMRGFQDWSWSTAYSLTNTAPVHTGTKSIKFTPQRWQAVFLSYPEGGDLKDYQKIKFWINGGSGSGQQISFAVVVSGSSVSSPLFEWTVPSTSIKANTWTQVELTFSALGKVAGYFDGIWFQSLTDAAQPTVYLDDIYFMHVHAGGAAPEVVDLCASVTCPTNSLCTAGTCTCTNGYGGASCTVAPAIRNVLVKTLAGTTVTKLTGGENLLVSWTSAGSPSQISMNLESSVSTIPTVLLTQVVNSGTYQWMVPENLAPGTYYIKVFYSSSVSARSSGLVKSSAAGAGCSDPYCSGHGFCDADTSFKCTCRYGWTGTACATPPTGVSFMRLSGSLTVSRAYSQYQADAKKFNSIIRSDLAAALLVKTDQIEVTQVTSATKGGSAVKFDVLFGGQFTASALALKSSSELSEILDQQLDNSDSSLNRGTNTYSSTDGNAAAVGAQASLAAVAVAVGAALLW